jgi:hypothetical protein
MQLARHGLVRVPTEGNPLTTLAIGEEKIRTHLTDKSRVNSMNPQSIGPGDLG